MQIHSRANRRCHSSAQARHTSPVPHSLHPTLSSPLHGPSPIELPTLPHLFQRRAFVASLVVIIWSRSSPFYFAYLSASFSACFPLVRAPFLLASPFFHLLRQCLCMYIEPRLQRDTHSFLFGSPARYVTTRSLVQSNRLNFGSPASAEPNNVRLLRPLHPQLPLQLRFPLTSQTWQIYGQTRCTLSKG